jgi:netrin-G1 ligand
MCSIYHYLSSLSLYLLSSQLLLFLSTILLMTQTQQTVSTITCPSMCSCIWRNGKQTALCEKQSLISIPSGISSATQVLNLNKNNFQILPSKVFQERGLINLQKVFLAECKLGVIADDAFTQLTNLIELDLSTNLLTQVPTKSLKDCFNLRRLQLNANPIQIIRAEAFLPLTHLKSLDLSGI